MDMASTIIPKSDQLNADDLIAAPRVVTITKVRACPGEDAQPVAVHFEGDDGKPYKPCKSMRRVLVLLWGVDASQYVGRAMKLYRDPAVMFGGIQVGGIRISHMSHIDETKTLTLTASRSKRAPFKVEPLVNGPSTPIEGANLREAARAMEPSPTQDNEPLDAPLLRLVDATGKLHDLRLGLWRDTLIKAITTKPFDSAQMTFLNNKKYVEAAYEAGNADVGDAARKVEAAWRTRERAQKAVAGDANAENIEL